MPALAPITVTEDTYIDGALPTTPNGGVATLVVSLPAGPGSSRLSLQRFPLSTVPAGAVAKTAFVTLIGVGGAGSPLIRNTRILQTGWVEATATWDTYDGSNAWGNNGCSLGEADYTNRNRVSEQAATPGVDFVTENIAGMVNDALDAGATYLEFRTTTTASGTSYTYEQGTATLTISEYAITVNIAEVLDGLYAHMIGDSPFNTSLGGEIVRGGTGQVTAGRFWMTQAKRDETMPFAVYTLIDIVPFDAMGQEDGVEIRVQITVWTDAESSTGRACQAISDQGRDRLAYRTFAVTDHSVTTTEADAARGPILDGNAWRCDQDYILRVTRP